MTDHEKKLLQAVLSGAPIQRKERRYWQDLTPHAWGSVLADIARGYASDYRVKAV